MTTLQKAIITTALVASVGTGLNQAHQASQLRDQVQVLEQESSGRFDKLKQENDKLTSRLAAATEENDRLREDLTELPKLRGEVTRLSPKSAELARLKATESNKDSSLAVKSWGGRVQTLKEHFERSPEAARVELDSEANLRYALSRIRNAAESKFAGTASEALRRFSKANDKQIPSKMAQLQPFFDSSVDPAILEQWEFVPAKEIPGLGFGTEMMITQKTKVDDVFDTLIGIGPKGGWGSTSSSSKLETLLRPVYKTFNKANEGIDFDGPPDLSQFLPYTTTEEQRIALENKILRNSVTK